MIYGQDWTRPKYVVALNPDLTEIVAPDKEMSFEERINNYQLEISIKRSGLELIEKNICAMLGTVVGDGSLLSDCVMRMVWDGDEASVQQLTQAYYSSGGQTAAA